MRIGFIAYNLFDSGLVGSLRPRSLAKILQERDNQLIYYARDSWGKRPATSKLIWSLICFWRLLWEEADKIYVSCGPFWHLSAIWLACILTNKKVIYDFRDPWSVRIRDIYGSQIPKENPVVFIALKWAELIERLIYRHCDRFWVCTPGMYDLYTELFGDNEKLDLVLNGYDFDDVMELGPKVGSPERLHIVCLGKFACYGLEKASNVLEELKNRISQHGPKSLLIEFVGPDSETQRLVQRIGLEKNAILYPKMSYLKAVHLAAKADMGLCILRNEEYELGTKAFDYIGLGLLIYDTFEDNSNARQFYEPFVSKDKHKVIDPTLRAAYHRRNRFKDFLEKIDGKRS
jgi:hypothetical protein